MTAVAPSRARFRWDFYVIMAIVLVAIVAFGFSHTVPDDFATPGFPWFLAAHGAEFAAWMVLFVVQPVLIIVRAPALHRTLGWLALAIAVAMLGLGGYAILFGLRSGHVPPFYPHGLFLIRGSIALLTFFGLVLAAIVNRRRAQWHKRLLLCATIVLIVPALERSLPLPLMGSVWPFYVDAIADAILLVGPVVDLIARRRVHPAYAYGLGAVVLGQLTTDLLAPSPIATAMLRAIGVR